MSERWFWAPEDRWSDSDIALPETESRHALRVLRVSSGDLITVTDGRGRVARCGVRIEPAGVVAEILEVAHRPRPRPEIVVYQGAAKGSKNDDLVERLGELGVAELTVFTSERSVVTWDASALRRRAERWAAHSVAAAKLARSPHVMATSAPISWSALLGALRAEPSAIVLWEGAALPLRTAFVEATDRVALVVGPEGGLSVAEAEALADAGGQLVSLGPRIFRTENAPVVAASALLFHYGLIG